MKNSTIRIWAWVHKWTSLISTIFLLLLCLTGLPLIFHHEIDHLLESHPEPVNHPAGAPKADLDRVVANALAHFPDHVVQFVSWDDEEPNLVYLSIAESPDANPEYNRFLLSDAGNANFLGEYDFRKSFTYIMYRLHVDLFAGLPGKLFLGLMGIFFCVAIVSGIVLYAPSMRKLDFGAVRRGRNRIVRWLDLHNLLGVVTIVWALTVGLTGVINTWADLVLKLWQYDQLAEMTAAYKDLPRPQTLSPLQAAVDTAKAANPGMTLSFVAYPGSSFSSKTHYAVFLHGETPLTSRLVRPALIDATTGELTDSRDMPWYAKVLLISQPLHFGDYGGTPLRIIWALMTVATIVVLVTGLYLWVKRRKPMLRPRGARIARGGPALKAAS